MSDDNYLNKVLHAVNNDRNESILKLNTSLIKQRKNDILQQLHLNKSCMKTYHKKLKKYRYCNDIRELRPGSYIRWIPLRNPDTLYLKPGAILCSVNGYKNRIYMNCKTFGNTIITLKFDDNVIFQKLSAQELILLKVMDHIT
jgi:hypothetical protein